MRLIFGYFFRDFFSRFLSFSLFYLLSLFFLSLSFSFFLSLSFSFFFRPLTRQAVHVRGGVFVHPTRPRLLRGRFDLRVELRERKEARREVQLVGGGDKLKGRRIELMPGPVRTRAVGDRHARHPNDAAARDVVGKEVANIVWVAHPRRGENARPHRRRHHVRRAAILDLALYHRVVERF